MVNTVSKGKYSFNLKQYCTVTSLLKSFDVDIKRKASVFNITDINRFLMDKEASSPYWTVRKTIVCLAYYGGLRHTEMMEIKIELCESTSEGVYVTHSRAKQRSDKRISKFLVPRTDMSRSADIVDEYIRVIKEKLGKFVGRLLWTGNAKTFVNLPMGRNTVSKVPSDMAERINLNNDNGEYTFHSFRRSAATAVADSGATSEQMRDFFGWSSTKMTSEYISTSKAAVINISNKLATLDNNTGNTAEHKANTPVEEELDQEVKSLYENQDLWDGWTGDMEVNHQTPASKRRINSDTNPMKIESGGKVFNMSNCTITNFTC